MSENPLGSSDERVLDYASPQTQEGAQGRGSKPAIRILSLVMAALHFRVAAHGQHWNNLAWLPATFCFKAEFGVLSFVMLVAGLFLAGLFTAIILGDLLGGTVPRGKACVLLVFVAAMYLGFPVPKGCALDGVLMNL